MNDNKNLRIVITGGHFTPAIAVIDEFKKKGWDIYWIGISQAVTGQKVETLEKKELPVLGIPFYPIGSLKFDRNSKVKSLLGVNKLFAAIKQCFHILKDVKPQAILSFGSFVSFPVALAAWVRGIPIVIHEQTTASGMANKIVSLFSDKVAVSFKTNENDFPQEKVLLTGNPVRAKIFEVAKLKSIKKVSKKPVLYITGGSRGSQAINTAVLEALPDLVKNYQVIHQVGDFDYKRIERESKKLKMAKSQYSIYPTLTLTQVEKIFLDCDLAISRSGANTVSEFAILSIPALFIPLPNSASDEQFKNAKLLENLGVARILQQTDLSGKSLFEEIEIIRKNIKQYKLNSKRARALIPENAAKSIVEIIENLV